MTTWLWLVPVALMASWLLTAVMRRYALAARLLDVPNARSSHAVTTPRGGGVAIVSTFLACLAWLSLDGNVPHDLLRALLVSGAIVALIGFADDKWQLAARWRFLGHSLAAAWVLWQLGPLPTVPLFGFDVPLGMPGIVLAAVYLVWAINFFNFMDGIDGIAGVEAIVVALGGALVSWLAQPTLPWIVSAAFTASIAGFLLWNLPPARIFMGDAGSGFLGLVIGTLSLWHGYEAPHLFWSWFALQGCFMVDATTTLVRRVQRGERPQEAHRSHAYQYASRLYGGHRPVTLAYGAVTVFWLLPIAAAIAVQWIDGALGVCIAYAPLVVLARRYRAGARELQEV
jgi:Fuc2NAc and GlcNAc transferase